MPSIDSEPSIRHGPASDLADTAVSIADSTCSRPLAAWRSVTFPSVMVSFSMAICLASKGALGRIAQSTVPSAATSIVATGRTSRMSKMKNFAAQERRELGIHRKRLDGHRRFRATTATDAHIGEGYGRKRQDARGDIALDRHLAAEYGAGLALEIGLVARPVDEIRPHQRRTQRQYEQSTEYHEQACEHCLGANLLKRPRRLSAGAWSFGGMLGRARRCVNAAAAVVP